jgi:hypothetical protein
MEIKGKTEDLLVKQFKNYLWKEYARMHQIHQKTKPEIHGHWRRRRGIRNILKQNNNRKFPKSRENYAHPGTGSLKDTKQTWSK